MGATAERYVYLCCTSNISNIWAYRYLVSLPESAHSIVLSEISWKHTDARLDYWVSKSIYKFRNSLPSSCLPLLSSFHIFLNCFFLRPKANRCFSPLLESALHESADVRGSQKQFPLFWRHNQNTFSIPSFMLSQKFYQRSSHIPHLTTLVLHIFRVRQEQKRQTGRWEMAAIGVSWTGFLADNFKAVCPLPLYCALGYSNACELGKGEVPTIWRTWTVCNIKA